jgi:hypothetical protein
VSGDPTPAGGLEILLIAGNCPWAGQLFPVTGAAHMSLLNYSRQLKYGATVTFFGSFATMRNQPFLARFL